MLRLLAIGQGFFYLVTGIWPLVSIRTFMAMTGPKVDTWLVNTVGVLVAVVGATLLYSGIRSRVTTETVMLAAGCALGLASIDLVYVLGGRIGPIYLLDAAAEGLLVAGWFVAWFSRSKQP